jgi:hypothetical protein
LLINNSRGQTHATMLVSVYGPKFLDVHSNHRSPMESYLRYQGPNYSTPLTSQDRGEKEIRSFDTVRKEHHCDVLVSLPAWQHFLMGLGGDGGALDNECRRIYYPIMGCWASCHTRTAGSPRYKKTQRCQRGTDEM